MKNKIKYLASAVSVTALTLPVAVFAQFQAPVNTNLPHGSIREIVQTFMQWLLIIVGIMGVIGFAIAGILYLTAAGDEERIGSAKKAMTYSIVGVIVALLGLVILQAANRFLGGETTNF